MLGLIESRDCTLVSAVINRLQLILVVNDQRVWVVGKKKSRKTYPLLLNTFENQKFLKFSTSFKCELCVCCRNFATSWWNGPEAASASSQRSKRVAVLQYGNIFSNRITYSLKTHVYLLTVWFAHIVLFVVDCVCYSSLEASISVRVAKEALWMQRCWVVVSVKYFRETNTRITQRSPKYLQCSSDPDFIQMTPKQTHAPVLGKYTHLNESKNGLLMRIIIQSSHWSSFINWT